MKHGMTDWGVDASNNMHMETESPVFFQTPMTVCIVQRSFCTLAVVRTSLVRAVNTRTLSTTTARSVAMNIGSSRRYPRLELTERKIMMNIMALIIGTFTVRASFNLPNGRDSIRGMTMNRIRYFRISKGLTASPINANDNSGVTAIPMTYVADTPTKATSMFSCVITAAMTTAMAHGMDARMTQPYHIDSLNGRNSVPMAMVTAVLSTYVRRMDSIASRLYSLISLRESLRPSMESVICTISTTMMSVEDGTSIVSMSRLKRMAEMTQTLRSITISITFMLSATLNSHKWVFVQGSKTSGPCTYLSISWKQGFYGCVANRGTMDIDSAFNSIKDNIKDGNNDLALSQVKEIVESNIDSPEILIKCASLLKVIEAEDDVQSILDTVMSNLPSDEDELLKVAVNLRGLGRIDDAYSIYRSLKTKSPDLYDLAQTLYLLDEYESAMAELLKADGLGRKERILLTECYSAVGEYSKAETEAQALLDEFGPAYDILVNMSRVLFEKGDAKGAVKFAKSYLKEDKKNLDNLALNAYVMRINGKTMAAVNYSTRVLNADYTHVGALETLAYCHIERKSYVSAKLLAGAINDADPGNPAAVRILDACRLMSS